MTERTVERRQHRQTDPVCQEEADGLASRKKRNGDKGTVTTEGTHEETAKDGETKER